MITELKDVERHTHNREFREGTTFDAITISSRHLQMYGYQSQNEKWPEKVSARFKLRFKYSFMENTSYMERID